MINLRDDYVIEVDPLNYTLKKDMKTKDKKTGNPVYKIIGYYSTLESCIKGFIDLMQREKLAEGEYTLNEALNALRDIYSEFNTLLEKALLEAK